ncbi:MAG: radical SAM protein [Lachnospiraceae bacterium]|nr:radical SAM protein [Lachnospiraceae bacterium]
MDKTGFCSQTDKIRAARAALHYWEEPVLSGSQGSGAVFFSGCNLKCVFCQNYHIAIGECGKEITVDRLSDIFLELQDKGAHNINLVTGAPYIPHIKEALIIAKNNGLTLPILYNSSGYESVDALKMLDGLIDIYLPDMKYFSSELSALYSHAPNYFEYASAAIAEMVRQVGSPVIEAVDDAVDYNNEPLMLMKKGVIVRHLLLPGQTKDSKKILRYLFETYGNHIYISIMNQYTPLPQVEKIPELNRQVTADEYDRVVNFAIKLGIENAFIQNGETAKESFIPAFNYEGI